MGDVIPLRPRRSPQPCPFAIEVGFELEPPPEDLHEFEPPYEDEEGQ